MFERFYALALTAFVLMLVSQSLGATQASQFVQLCVAAICACYFCERVAPRTSKMVEPFAGPTGSHANLNSPDSNQDKKSFFPTRNFGERRGEGGPKLELEHQVGLSLVPALDFDHPAETPTVSKLTLAPSGSCSNLASAWLSLH